MNPILSSSLVWSAIGSIVYVLWAGTRQHAETITDTSSWHRALPAIVALGCVAVCTMTMSINPHWSGDGPDYHNQYGVLAESILDGRIDLDYGDMDPKLLELDNPYDPAARDAAGVHYHWDHALYDGRYYTYFGIVPTLLLFLPYRILTGASLATYRATQIFTALLIIGIFVLFRYIAQKFFPKMKLAVYLALSAGMSFMSVWYFVVAPALYCTAIAAGVCMEIWSLIFFVRCIWTDNSERRQCARYGIAGSLFGALSFGCRPTVALVNFLAAPLMLYYLKKKRLGAKRIVIVFLPYVIVGVLLMYYNYVRFDSPFEFGQSYQLTLADLSPNGDFHGQFEPMQIVNGILQQFIAAATIAETFPYVSQQSVFFNFPICIVGILCLFQKDTLSEIHRDHVSTPMCILIVSLLAITSIQVLQSPYLLERYRSDLYWIVGILLFVSFGFFLDTLHDRSRRVFDFVICILALTTTMRCFLLWAQPIHDASFTDIYPEYLDLFPRMLTFGLAGNS